MDRNALRAGKEKFGVVMDAANRDAYIRQWVERVKEFNSAEEVRLRDTGGVGWGWGGGRVVSHGSISNIARGLWLI